MFLGTTQLGRRPVEQIDLSLERPSAVAPTGGGWSTGGEAGLTQRAYSARMGAGLSGRRGPRSQVAKKVALAEAARAWRLDAEGLEAAIGYRFRDRDLLVRAVDSWVRGHGALETLGDAINDLAVMMATIRAGRHPRHAVRAVTNEALAEVSAAKLAGLCRHPTGDNVETIVGAVHLDGGFNAAAAVGVGLCTDLAWDGLPERDLPHGGITLDVAPYGSDARSFGILAIEAGIVEFHLEEVHPRWPSQRELAQARERCLSSRNFVDLGERRFPGSRRARGYRAAVRATVGRVLMESGWPAAAQAVFELVITPDRNATPED